MAVDPRNCGVCVLGGNAVTHVGHGRSALEHSEWLVEHCSGANAVGVDVPFGWPRPFVDALRDYKIGVALNHDRRPYRLRSTDAWIAETLPQVLTRSVRPPTPFSVSTDKLGATAMLGTILLGALSGEFRLSPRQSGVSGAVLEVYPAASSGAGAYAIETSTYPRHSPDYERFSNSRSIRPTEDDCLSLGTALTP